MHLVNCLDAMDDGRHGWQLMSIMGHTQANGVLAYFTTLALFFLGWQCRAFSPARVYDLFGEILAALNIFSLLFCLFLFLKARPCFDKVHVECALIMHRCEKAGCGACRHASKHDATVTALGSAQQRRALIVHEALASSSLEGHC